MAAGDQALVADGLAAASAAGLDGIGALLGNVRRVREAEAALDAVLGAGGTDGARRGLRPHCDSLGRPSLLRYARAMLKGKLSVERWASVALSPQPSSDEAEAADGGARSGAAAVAAPDATAASRHAAEAAAAAAAVDAAYESEEEGRLEVADETAPRDDESVDSSEEGGGKDTEDESEQEEGRLEEEDEIASGDVESEDSSVESGTGAD